MCFRLRTLMIVLALICAALGYSSAYLRTLTVTDISVPTGPGPYIRTAYYSRGGTVAEMFFYPANAVDRLIRVRYWNVPEEDLPE